MGEVGFFGGIGRGDLREVRQEGFWGSFDWSGVWSADLQISQVLVIAGHFFIKPPKTSDSHSKNDLDTFTIQVSVKLDLFKLVTAWVWTKEIEWVCSGGHQWAIRTLEFV